MVDLSTLACLLLLASLLIVLIAARAVCAIVCIRGGGSRLVCIGVGRIVRKARHGTKSGVVGGTRQSHPTLCLLYVSVILLSVLVIYPTVVTVTLHRRMYAMITDDH